MNNTCENCKNYNKAGTFSFCKQEQHLGVIVPAFTTCPDYEEKVKTPMPFGDIKFYLVNPATGEMRVAYICECCGEEMNEPFHWEYRIPVINARMSKEESEKIKARHGYHYWCKECWQKKEKTND